MGLNVAEMKFAAFPGMPTCTSGAVVSGDPSKGASILYAKMATGCAIPWHWHTPSEHLMMVSGEGQMDMKEASLTLKAGGFALMPSHHPHQFRCLAECALYVYSDAAFDIHYLDPGGQEITPEAAMKAVKQMAAPVPR